MFPSHDLATTIVKIMDYRGIIRWDTTKPNGQYRKPSDNNRLIELGWDTNNFTDIDSGLLGMCKWYMQNYPNVRGVE